jgi:glycosyltransferase involved in cell wall biosynthesis
LKLLLTFTFNVSLEHWKNNGTLHRELSLYSKLFKDHGVTTTLLTYGDKTDAKILGPEYNFVTVLPMFDKKVTNKFLRMIYSIIFILKNKKTFLSFDLIKTNQLHGSWIALLVSIISKKKFIIRMGYNFFDQNPNSQFNYIYNHVYKLLLLRSSKIISSTQSIKQSFLQKYKVNSEKILVIPNFIDTEIFYNQSHIRDSNTILNVGRLYHDKNHEYLIEIVSKINLRYQKNLKILIIGSGQKKSFLKDLAHKKNISLNIIDKIDNNHLPEIYNKHTFFISSSLIEGHPKVILEAMSCGCVVIAPNQESFKNIITDNMNGYIYDYNDIEKSIERINHVLSEKNKLDQISYNAENYIKANCNLDKITLLEYETYKKCTP